MQRLIDLGSRCTKFPCAMVNRLGFSLCTKFPCERLNRLGFSLCTKFPCATSKSTWVLALHETLYPLSVCDTIAHCVKGNCARSTKKPFPCIELLVFTLRRHAQTSHALMDNNQSSLMPPVWRSTLSELSFFIRTSVEVLLCAIAQILCSPGTSYVPKARPHMKA